MPRSSPSMPIQTRSVPAARTGVLPNSRIRSMTCSTSALSAPTRITTSIVVLFSGRACAAHCLAQHLQVVLQQPLTALGHDRLWVELHAFDGQPAVAHAHDETVFGPGGDFEIGR